MMVCESEPLKRRETDFETRSLAGEGNHSGFWQAQAEKTSHYTLLRRFASLKGLTFEASASASNLN